MNLNNGCMKLNTLKMNIKRIFKKSSNFTIIIYKAINTTTVCNIKKVLKQITMKTV